MQAACHDKLYFLPDERLPLFFFVVYTFARGIFHFMEMFMATSTSRKLTSAERQVVADALDMYVKSIERAERAAKDANVAAAYRDAGGKVRVIQAAVTSGELEI